MDSGGIASPDIEKHITELQKRVSEYTTYNSTYKSTLPFSFKMNSIYIYAGIPVAIFILLLISRPGFVKTEVTLESGEVQMKTNFKKILMWSLIFGTIIVVAMYVLNHRKKNS